MTIKGSKNAKKVYKSCSENVVKLEVGTKTNMITKLINREAQINELTSKIKRIVQIGGNQYWERFDSFAEPR